MYQKNFLSCGHFTFIIKFKKSGTSLEADRIVFVFGPKNDDFSVFGLLFFGRKSLTYFRFYFIFRPNNPPKTAVKCIELTGKWSLESKHFAAAAATSLHAAWLTVNQQGMAISRRRWYSADYAASEQVVKSRHFELGPGANRRFRSHCPDNETHSTLANN